MKDKDCKNVSNNDTSGKSLNAYSLAGIGIGGIIGAGFFLGSSLAINQAGPSVILAFIFGGLIMSQVLGAMTSMSINRPVQGSFRVYTEEFLGKFTGFTLGWVVFISGIFTLGSEAVASAVFFKYWLPHISSAIFAVSAVIIVIIINGFGSKYFGYIETVMSIAKIAILIIFIIVGVIFIMSHGIIVKHNPFTSISGFFPNKFSGFLQSMLVVIFTYSGISSVAMATSEVRKPCIEIPKASVILVFGTVILYSASMFVIVSTVDWNLLNTNASPFVQVFGKIGYGWASAIINAVILIATFSVMAGTYYGCMQVLVSLASANEAPHKLQNKTKRGFFKGAWIITGIVSMVVVLISFFLGSKLFNYLVSSCSYFSFFNWVVNLLTYLVWLKRRSKDEIYNSPLIKGRFGAILTIIVVIFLFVVSLKVPDFRTGFYVALAIMLLISISHKFVKE